VSQEEAIDIGQGGSKSFERGTMGTGEGDNRILELGRVCPIGLET
jgi:hypothetical protein